MPIEALIPTQAFDATNARTRSQEARQNRSPEAHESFNAQNAERNQPTNSVVHGRSIDISVIHTHPSRAEGADVLERVQVLAEKLASIIEHARSTDVPAERAAAAREFNEVLTQIARQAEPPLDGVQAYASQLQLPIVTSDSQQFGIALPLRAQFEQWGNSDPAQAIDAISRATTQLQQFTTSVRDIAQSTANDTNTITIRKSLLENISDILDWKIPYTTGSELNRATAAREAANIAAQISPSQQAIATHLNAGVLQRFHSTQAPFDH